MIYLSGALAAALIGRRVDLGLMISFRGRHTPHSRRRLSGVFWGGDNGCFTNPDLDVDQYFAWLERLKPYRETCLFVPGKDRVGDALATWELSEPMLPRIRALGFPAALVAQDGIEARPIKWDAFDCLFIGGSTEWKLSGEARALCREATRRGKWCHMGRVNSYRRIVLARAWGCHSTDGTKIAFAPDQNIKQVNKWLDFLNAVPVQE